MSKERQLQLAQSCYLDSCLEQYSWTIIGLCRNLNLWSVITAAWVSIAGETNFWYYMDLRRFISKSDAYMNFFNGKGTSRKTINKQVQQHTMKIQHLIEKTKYKRYCVNDALNQKKLLTAIAYNRSLHRSASAMQIRFSSFQHPKEFAFFSSSLGSQIQTPSSIHKNQQIKRGLSLWIRLMEVSGTDDRISKHIFSIICELERTEVFRKADSSSLQDCSVEKSWHFERYRP